MSASSRLLLGLALGAATLTAAPAAPVTHARTLHTLYRFTGGADGLQPGALVLKDGELYGTTYAGGMGGFGCGPFPVGCGTVFKFDPATGTLTTLHAFTGGFDGGNSNGGVVFDATGALYGTTTTGGSTSGCGPLPGGCGTVFKLDLATQTLTTIYAFAGRQDGARPEAGLIFRNGMLYGTTQYGGLGVNDGTVFALNPKTHKLTTLHSFCALPNCVDGYEPVASLAFDTTGMLYGTTSVGGTGGNGTVFQLEPVTQTLTTLRSFNRDDSLGSEPVGGLVVRNGKLFGTTTQGGANDAGTVFRLNPVTRHLDVLHSFTCGADGGTPYGNLTAALDPQSGVLYGTALGACNGVNSGTVFKLNAGTGTLTILHAFTATTATDGGGPFGGMVLDSKGALYGSTSGGGHLRGVCASSNVDGCGTVFKVDR